MAVTLDEIARLIPAHADVFKVRGVFSVRPGYLFRDGWITREPAIVLTVDRNATDLSLPTEIQGIPVDVRRATPIEQLRFEKPAQFARLAGHRLEWRGGAFPELDPAGLPMAADMPRGPAETGVGPAKPNIPYSGPGGVNLSQVTNTFTITCSASPDAGWLTLKPFLSTVSSHLTVGLYDFTSQHILETLTQALQGGKGLTLTLDNPPRNPTADQTDSQTRQTLQETMGDAAHLAWALVQTNTQVPEWIFPTAYHIKVAVKDGQSFWLSSGNWNNSNQPDIDPINDPIGSANVAAKSDRDWHVIVEHPGLAQTFEAYLRHDYEVASTVEGGPAGEGLAAEIKATAPEEFAVPAPTPVTYFPPLVIQNTSMTVQPLLTPDNYHSFMRDLIQSAETSLYVQLQYIHPSDLPEDADFAGLIAAVVQKITAGKDVRIILSQYQASNGWLEKLQAAGVDMGIVRLQNGVHNKGFVVDGKVVALGSHNWSGDGALRNRDASLIIYNEQVAQYFQSIFLHDWENLAQQRVAD